MASWLEWLGSLLSDLWAPRPGTHEARLRAKKLGALLSKEANKPPEQQDAELIRSLNVSYRRAQLQNEQVGFGRAAARSGWGATAAGARPEVRWGASADVPCLACKAVVRACPAVQAMDVTYLERMLEWEEPAEHDKCCAAAGWVRQRMAASYRARRAYVGQRIQQVRWTRGRRAARRSAVPARLFPCAAVPVPLLFIPSRFTQPTPRPGPNRS